MNTWNWVIFAIFESQMIERTPKSECTRKIEQDRSISKILTFCQHLHKSQFFWKLDVCTISEIRMKKWVPKSECTRKIEWDRSVLKILTFWSTFAQKSTFFGNWMFAQFRSFEWRNGSQNRNVLEKLSGTGLFWKFWLSGQGQKSAWSKLFFFFWGGSDWVRFPGRSGLNLEKWVSSRWRHPWRHSVEGTCSTCGTCERLTGWGGA